MPKSYSEQEKEYIKKRLKGEAAKCLAQYGVRHTTDDEIVQRANIPKGTFYLFYKSKELLLFDVILEEHDSSVVEKVFPYYLLRNEQTKTLSVLLSVRFISSRCTRRSNAHVLAYS